ncbi:MAG TPA: acyl-[ACP]--phospholipid O-acyltransferase [Verrucomicrobiae bacterium]|nr:acyl-[ACP]--phospholipid O-acyltransferase [Verrucomicrobiae bacterium]
MTTSTSERPWRRGFWSLIVTQFQGAFSDNALKQLAIFVGISLGLAQAERDKLVSAATALLTLPFIIFSMAGGWLANHHSKRTVTIGVKIFEVLVMLLATAGLALGNLAVVLTCVFFMGVHSAIFGPSKYGSLPELVPEKRLSWGNGILELGTFLAIILGTVAGAALSQVFVHQPMWSGVVLIALAGVGLLTSLGITRVPAADPTKAFRWNFLGDLGAQWKIIRQDYVLMMAVIGNTYFWFLGVLLTQNIIIYSLDILRVDQTHTGYLQAALAIGIGVGSFAAGYLSGGKIEYGLIPLGSFGITFACALLGRRGLTFNTAAFELGLLGFSAGFFAVPINALMQHRPRKEDKAGVLAAQNLISSGAAFLAAGVYYLLQTVWPRDPSQIFLTCGVITFAGTLYVVWLVPDSLLRLFVWLFTHSFYRLRVEGRDNIPEKGGALFVCNHVSFVDALFIIGSTDRMIRAIMFQGIYDMPFVRPFAKAMKAIPISSQLRPREMIRSLHTASEAIKNGDVVCIFAEGQITRIGQLLPFRRGFERVMKDVDAPIIPVCLDHVWGSIFSYEKGRFLWKMPRYVPYPVTVSFGKPMPPTSTPFEVRQAVQDLNSEAWKNRRKLMMPIHRTFVRKARHHPQRFFMADGRVPRLRFGPALTRTVFLSRRLGAIWAGQEMVGILLPPSVGGALVNYAALLMGKVPVNLNYTANDQVIASCASQCGLQTVVTSKAFLDKVKVTVPGRTVLLEELAEKPGLGERLAAALMTWTLPVAVLERVLGRERKGTLDDLATVIFSSGSTGDPKGVMLTHYNIISNAEQMGQTFAFSGSDRILGILPFFHSFGFTGTLVVPAVLGLGVVYHVSPLDAKVIGALINQYRVTFLLATPTFLQMYIRGCEPEDFGSLQFVMTGAEKLPDRIAQAFEDRFGIRPLEGYGLTECSPAVTVNTHDFRAAGFRQVGAKRGKIGHPLPGISVRVVDPDAFQPLPVSTPGLLLVRGPNVMKGYLGKPEKTAEVLRDGWYVTGDIAALDEDGFLTITDRLTRFSKIGGEMVPHIRVEDKLHELTGATEQCFAVAGVPDEKKGERLVVLHTLKDGQLAPVLEKLAASDLPNLWKPRADQFFHIDALPYLGTGKLDLRNVREQATSLSNRDITTKS